MIDVNDVVFNQDGLIPAIVQDYKSNKVLMLAYMNKESLEITLQEKRTCFYSRSRRQLWRKGETSGNVQHVVSIAADCDTDTLLLKVNRDGPACHTGEDSCFFQEVYTDDTVKEMSITKLYDLLLTRKSEPKEGSYTSYLFEKGREKILKKIGEESTEVVIAALKNDNQETIFETADLCYHMLVLMVECGISPDDILTELAKRHVVDHKVKQETMK